LKNLIGAWAGDKGLDVAPDPDSTEHNPYSETTTVDIYGKIFEHTDRNELIRQ
jgi:hypothetical protein